VASRKISSSRSYFVALADAGDGSTLLVETPESQRQSAAPSPGSLRVNRAHLPFGVKDGQIVFAETTVTSDEKTRSVSVLQDLVFVEEDAGIPPAATLVQAGKAGASGKEVSEMARSRLDAPADVAIGSRWVIMDPEDMPNLARRVLQVLEVASDFVSVEVENEFGEFLDSGRLIPTDWFSTRLVEVGGGK
jgi:hypothetical protein